MKNLWAWVAGTSFLFISGCVTLPAESEPSPSPSSAPIRLPTPTVGPTSTPAPTAPASAYFYISPTGDDASGNGTSARPWKTLAKATASVTQVGAMIHVNAGTYVESQTSLLAPGVSIEGEGDGSIIRSTLSARWTPILLLQSPEGTAGNQSISRLKFDGNNLTTSVGLVVAGRSNVSIHHCAIQDFREVGASFSGITNWMGATAPTIYATGNSFYANRVRNCSNYVDSAYGTGNVQFGGQIGFLLYDNDISQPSRGQGGQGIGWPIKMANEGHIKGCKIYNNTLTKEPYTGAYGGDNGWNFSVEFWNVEGFEISNNRIQGTVDIANAQKGAYGYGLSFHDNVVSEPALSRYYEGGILLETDESDISVVNNIFRNLSSGVEFAPHDYGNNKGIDVHRVTIRGNLFENIGIVGGGQGVAIRWHNSDVNTVTRVSDIDIDQNTVTSAPGGDAGIVGIGLPGYPGVSPGSNIQVRNNIVRGFSYTGSHGLGSGLQNVTFTNNLFYQNGNQDDPMYVGGAPTNYTFQNHIKADPLFISGSDLHLSAASPAIDRGVNIGQLYLGLAPDLGCYERQ